MAEHKLTSLPVVDTKNKNKCLGMVDTLDVASYVLLVAPDATQLKENELKSLEIAGRAMALETVRSILSTCKPFMNFFGSDLDLIQFFFLDASGRDPYVPIIENEACTFVINLFARGLHRVPIIGKF
jgi:CBS domain-containing protein